MTARLRLVPLISDGRCAIRLAPSLNDHFILGRTSRDTPNGFGLRDTRVSRRHLRVDLSSDGESIEVTALGPNPIAVLHADMPAHGSGAEPRLRTVLSSGQRASVHPDDTLQLVLEDRFNGSEDRRAGNPCSYRLERCSEPLNAESRDVSVASSLAAHGTTTAAG